MKPYGFNKAQTLTCPYGCCIDFDSTRKYCRFHRPHHGDYEGYKAIQRSARKAARRLARKQIKEQCNA